MAPLDLAGFADLNVTRIAVEGAALRLSMASGDDDWDAGMTATAWRMKKADEALRDGRETLDRSEAANTAFMPGRWRPATSQWLLRVRVLPHDQCARFRLASVGRRRVSRDLTPEHAAIADAVLARDTEAACRLTAEHYTRTAAELAANAA